MTPPARKLRARWKVEWYDRTTKHIVVLRVDATDAEQAITCARIGLARKRLVGRFIDYQVDAVERLR